MFQLSTRILVVDDFTTMRRIVGKILFDLGYRHIFEASDGTEAWPLITTAAERGEPFGLIICDWKMPQMGGLELVKKIRSKSEVATTPLMMVLAESEREHIKEALASGVNEYLVKPFNGATLRAKLEATSNQQRKASA